MLPFILKSLRHYWRNHLAVLAGVFLASAVLTGALLVGDSLKATLKQLAEQRNGRIEQALLGNDRFFRALLADETAGQAGMKATPLLQVHGAVANETDTERVNGIEVIGIRPDFGVLGKDAQPVIIGSGKAALNEALAARLSAKVGDTIIARVELPGAISRDAPLSGETDSTVPLRLVIERILGVDQFGDYSLKAEQTSPLNLFLPLDDLAKALAKQGRANVVLFSGQESSPGLLASALDRHWVADDADLVLSQSKGTWDLVSRRVLIDPSVAEQARKIAPEAKGVFTYLVTSLAANGQSCPYSMVSAIESGPGDDILPPDMRGDGIVINQWLADDLGVKVGDTLTLGYFVFAVGRKLEDRTHPFQVARILPMDHPALDPRWTPEFPGVSEADNCRDWKPGMAIDLNKIRDKDEEYWDKYKGTPKAFIALATGQELWRNRFGQLTSLRFGPTLNQAQFAASFNEVLKPSSVGVYLVPTRLNSAKAVANSSDLGMYLIGFSYFLIVAALVLTTLLFVFGIDQRESQIGLLRALGFTPGKTRRFYLVEGGIVALAGALLGILGAVVFTKVMLWAMSTVWREATSGLRFRFALTPMTALSGAYASFFIALMAMFFASKRIAKKSPVAMLQSSGEATAPSEQKPLLKLASFWLMLPCLVLGLASIAAGLRSEPSAMAAAFSAAGFLLLLAGLFAANLLLRQAGHWLENKRGLGLLGIRNATRRRWRSLAVMIVMAAGVFMIVAVNAFQQDAAKDAGKRDSGTGGFAFIGESSLPIYEDLNSKEGREQYGLDEDAPFKLLSFRVKDGEEASCLNLNQAQQPRLMAVNPKELAERAAFTFQKHAWKGQGSPWQLLMERSDDAVPGILDFNSASYALKLGLGDTISYTDEFGRPLLVKIVGLLKNSILQGNILIPEAAYLEKYPSAGGYRYFLADVPTGKEAGVKAVLTRMLEARGLSLISATDRLNAFNAVQNSYLKMFSTLGGLGLLLGTFGLAVVVFRNVLERRRELALMEAVGFTRRRLAWLVLTEHCLLHVAAVGLGAACAFLSIYPAISKSGQDIPLRTMSILIASILVAGLLFCWLAARGVLRRPMLDALRHE